MVEILGEDGEVYEVEGDDLVGEDEYDIEGAAPARSPLALALARRSAGRLIRPAARPAVLRMPPKPQWRKKALAPGVVAPGEFMQPLPLTPLSNDGVFDATHSEIVFQANPQRPYQPERLVAAFASNTAPSGVLLRISVISVGVDVEQANLADMPLAAFAPTAFGVRMKLRPCTPGILVTVRIHATGAFAAGPPAESIPCSIMFMGHAIA